MLSKRLVSIKPYSTQRLNQLFEGLHLTLFKLSKYLFSHVYQMYVFVKKNLNYVTFKK